MSTPAPDFELYADQKPFNDSIAPGWEAAFRNAVSSTHREPRQIRFLDLGCGDGKYFRFLLNQGLRPENIHGLEMSRKRIERCHALGWSQVFYQENPTVIPYADGGFDVVNFMEVIEHVPISAAPKLVAEIARVLAPGGRLLISTPNYPIKRLYDVSDAFLHGKWKRLKDDPTHITFYNHWRLSALLGAYFKSLQEWSFKDGFIYERIPRPFFRHKILYICGDARYPLTLQPR